MPERPDLRQIAEDIRDALADYDRSALAEILAYVFKEYVVQSPPPLLLHQTEAISDLEGLSFAELIATLQTRLDVPELSAFQVEGDQVRVRAGGVLVPVDVSSSSAPAAAPAASARPAPVANQGPTETAPSSSRATADEAAARGRADLAGRSPSTVEAPPPRPGGLRVSGRPASASGSSSASAPAGQSDGPEASPAPTPEPEPARPPDSEAESEPPDDDAAVRFSLLELD